MSTPLEISPILTLEEIFSLYPDELVLIVNPELGQSFLLAMRKLDSCK